MRNRKPNRIVRGFVTALFAALVASSSYADEGGVSFWLPGTYSSLAAVPGTPGWSLPIVYYYSDGSLGGSHRFVVGGDVTAGMDATVDMIFLSPTYVMARPMWGASSAITLGWAIGRTKVAVDAKLSGPNGAILEQNASDEVTGGGDLFPQWTLAWNKGTTNLMTYVMVGIPVGLYEPGRLATVGINHGAIDGGGGYTYLDSEAGNEFSAVLGFTYNFENPDTHYRNGCDSHLDWAASRTLSRGFQAGVAGYFYEQLGDDSGSGAVLGDFHSSVTGVGPQLGRSMEVGGEEWYVQAKAYWEFAAQNRPEGWNLSLTLAIPLGSKNPGSRSSP